jgi:hypothetical protein
MDDETQGRALTPVFRFQHSHSFANGSLANIETIITTRNLLTLVAPFLVLTFDRERAAGGAQMLNLRH